MRNVLAKADELRANGNASDSELYIAVLNRSPSAAKDLLDVAIESLTDEERENIKTGKAAPRAFLSMTKKGRNGKSPIKKVKDEIKAIKVSIKKLGKSVPKLPGKDLKMCMGHIQDQIKDLQELLSAIEPKLNDRDAVE